MTKYIVFFVCMLSVVISRAQPVVTAAASIVAPPPAVESFTTQTKVYKADLEIILSAGFESSQSGNTSTKYFLGYISKNSAYEYYTILKEQLDETYYQTLNCKIFFKYEEAYAVNPGALLNFTIYNASKTAMECPTLVKTYGPNYFTLDLIGYEFKIGEVYILEVTGEKGEKKYLRFKYLG